MKESKFYDKDFYLEQQNGSYISAKQILPLVNGIIRPSSVIDIGCGVGYWLKVCKEDILINDVVGIDGPYVEKQMLKIDEESFRTADLQKELALERKFDLAITMEVAEHIPESSADIFVLNMVNASDIILFSAAIVGQLGTYHINEQMPEYWAKKFSAHNYIPVDFIRPLIWNNDKIEYWYRQNILLFIKKGRLADFPALEACAKNTKPDFLLRIHPEKYFEYVKLANKLNSWNGFIRYKLYPLKKWFKSLGK